MQLQGSYVKSFQVNLLLNKIESFNLWILVEVNHHTRLVNSTTIIFILPFRKLPNEQNKIWPMSIEQLNDIFMPN